MFFVLFILITLITSGTQGLLMDESIAYWASSNEPTIFYSLLEYATLIGSTGMLLAFAIVIGLILFVKRSWRDFFFLLVSVLGGIVLVAGLQFVIKRGAGVVESKAQQEAALAVYSYPNEHTMLAAVILFFIMYLVFRYISNTFLKWAIGIILFLVFLFVLLSRMFIELYLASDVLGALLISVAWFFFCLFLFYRKARRRSVVYLHW